MGAGRTCRLVQNAVAQPLPRQAAHMPSCAKCLFAWPAGLYGRHLPITVSNFRSAVQQGLYTGTIFHKVLPGAFVQVHPQEPV